MDIQGGSEAHLDVHVKTSKPDGFSLESEVETCKRIKKSAELNDTCIVSNDGTNSLPVEGGTLILTYLTSGASPLWI
jgi:hypothetical protein